jgi:hypothetical protein
MMLHDVVDPACALAEAWRIVKPGGRLIASEYILDLCLPNAITQTDEFEQGKRDSSIVGSHLFLDPTEEVLELYRQLFALKHEPDRFLWSATEFMGIVADSLPANTEVSMSRSLTPFYSVDNWLGRSGFGLDVKQNGILKYLQAGNTVKNALGMVVTVQGEPIGIDQHADVLCLYEGANTEQRELLQVDVKIHPVFANVVAKKSN